MDDLKDTACGGDLLPQAEGDEMRLTYFKLFFTYLDAIQPLADDERGRLFTALLQYANTGEVPELTGNERFLFPMLKAQLDRDSAAYEAESERISKLRSEAGKKSAQVKATKSTNGNKSQQVLTSVDKCQQNQQTPTKPTKDKDKDKDKEEDKGKEEIKEKYKRKNVVDFADIQQADCYFPESQRLEQGLREWLAYKAERRETYKERGLTSLVTRIRNKVSEIGEDAVLESIADCMANNYQGLFFKEKRRERASGGGWNFSDFRRDNYHS